MQTKKRAKPVKFGKAAAAEKANKQTSPKPQEREKPAVFDTVSVEEEVTTVTVTKEPVSSVSKHEPVEELEKEVPSEEPLDEIEIPADLQKQLDTLRDKDSEDIQETDGNDNDEEDEYVSKKVSMQEPEEQEEKSLLEEKEDVDEKEEVQQEEEIPETEPLASWNKGPNPFGHEENPFERTQRSRMKKGGLVKHFILVALVAFLLGLAFIAGGYYAVQGKKLTLPDVSSLKSMVMHESPTPTETPTPTTTPVPTKADLSKNTMKILNGSGVKGEAAKLKEALTTAGFTIESTGNADNSDYDLTIVAAKKSVSKGYTDELVTQLEKTYKVDSKLQTLPDSSASDVTVTIGKETTK